MDDVATMEIGNRQIATDTISSRLIYFAKGDGGVALQGDRGPSGSRGWKGDSGDKDPLERGPEGPPGTIGKIR